MNRTFSAQGAAIYKSPSFLVIAGDVDPAIWVRRAFTAVVNAPDTIEFDPALNGQSITLFSEERQLRFNVKVPERWRAEEGVRP